MLFVEAQQTRKQPVLGYRMGADDADMAIAMAALEPLDVSQKLIQHRLDKAMKVLASAGQANAAGAAFEQLRAQLVFEQADLLAHRALGQIQLARCAGETAGTGHRLKGNQGVERRQVTAVAAHWRSGSL